MEKNILPVNEVLNMQKKAVPKHKIIETLKTKGLNQQQIADTLNQASIKQGVEGNMANPNEGMQVSAMDTEPQQETTQEDIPVPTPTPPPQTEAPQESAPTGENYPASSPQPIPQQTNQQPAGAYPTGILPPTQPAGGAYEDIQSLVEEIIDEKWRDLLSSIGDITAWKSQIGDEVEAVKQEILRVQTRFDNLQAAVLGKVEEYSTNVKDIGTEMKALEKVFEKILEPLTTNIKELSKITEKLKK